MGKCNQIETPLPEAMIHLIQSFLSEEEAAQTALVSKSWYNAWLTRPVLVLHRKSSAAKFSKFATKTMRRYQDSNLKIDSLRLKIQGSRRSFEPLAHKLIVDAMKLGATDLKIEFFTFVLPPEVLRSETLMRLSLCGCKIDGDVNCSMLESLSLDSVLLKSDDMLRNITSCCNSIVELSLSNSYSSKAGKRLSGTNLHELHKLKRLYLETVDVDKSFFNDLESRFPCLEDMSLVSCHGCREICVASSSLQRINIVQPVTELLKAKFRVPNLAVFSYSGGGIPIWSFSIEARDEWQSHISIELRPFETSSFYRDLPRLLTQLSPSRINLTISIVGRPCIDRIVGVEDIRDVAEPVAVENMRLETEYDAGCILRCLFRICRPKSVTHCWLDREWWRIDDHSLKSLCEKLTDSKINWNMFERFDLKEGKMEVYEDGVAEWRPLLLQDALRAPPMGRKVRFHLKW